MSERVDRHALPEVMKEVLGDRTQRAVAYDAEVNQTTIHNMLKGQRPGYRLSVKIADNLKLEGDLRRRYFEALGYADPSGGSAALEPYLEEATVEAFRGLRGAPQEDIAAINEEVRRLIARKRRARGLE
jgi:hypothetical protein